MNLTLYAITAFIILDTDGNRVLSKYYRQEHSPSAAKGLANTKEQRAFEKGLWQKTKKSGGPSTLANHRLPFPIELTVSIPPTWTRASAVICSGFMFNECRRYHPIRWSSGRIQTLSRSHLLPDLQPRRERADDQRRSVSILGRDTHAPSEPGREEGGFRESRPRSIVLR